MDQNSEIVPEMGKYGPFPTPGAQRGPSPGVPLGTSINKSPTVAPDLKSGQQDVHF